jgi:DNA-binding NarL/FixJ family response regulator
VLAVDDQASFREVIREVVGAADGFELVGEAASGEAALAAVARLKPRLVIMDKRMPGMGGVEASRVLTEQHPGMVVLIASVEDPESHIARASGAAFVRKQELSPRVLRELWQRYA